MQFNSDTADKTINFITEANVLYQKLKSNNLPLQTQNQKWGLHNYMK